MAGKAATAPGGAPRKRKAGKHPGGRPRWEPTKEERLLVELAVAAGYTQEQIAEQLGKSIDSLQRHCRTELDNGAFRANVKVSGALYTKAMKGDVTAIIWWEKTRRGMKDTSRHEHGGPNGGAIPFRFDLTGLSDEELEQLERIRTRIAVPGGNTGGEGAQGG